MVMMDKIVRTFQSLALLTNRSFLDHSLTLVGIVLLLCGRAVRWMMIMMAFQDSCTASAFTANFSL